MECTRFDRLTRRWSAQTPRRTVVGGLVSGVLGLTVLQDTEAKKKKKVTLCLNGQTISVKKSKKGSILSQGATQGACPSAPPAPPAPSCPATQKLCNGRCIDRTSCCTNSDCDRCKQQTCQNGTCACKPGTTADAQGICGVPLGDCTPTPAQTANASSCCSGNPRKILDFPVTLFACDAGTTTCRVDVDCLSGPCQGFMCPERYAATVGAGC